MPRYSVRVNQQELNKFPEGIILPDKPGVYLMKDIKGNIIYVGKATSLKNRVKSYFHDSSFTSAKISAIASNTSKIDYLITSSELEALMLESSLIKKYKPKYNVMYKDDKTYPFFKLTINENFPRLIITRKILSDNALYFGPYVAGSLKKMLRIIHKFYSICDLTVPITPKLKKPCFKEQLKLCAGVCIGKTNKSEYTKIVENVKEFLNGKQKELIEEIKENMLRASRNLEYESAASYRDQFEIMRLLYSQSESKIKFSKKVKEESKEKFLQVGLVDLKRRLNLKKLPQIIEAFDISNFKGEYPTGSLVVFKDGHPLKNEYRHFKIKGVKGIDDFAMLAEIVERRYNRLLEENKEMPDLILIDGGKGQLSKVEEVLEKLGIEVDLASLAKREEEIFIPGPAGHNAIRLSMDSASLHILQYIRDEAHRFAIKHHRLLLRKKIKESVLDEIHGIGEVRKREILKYFGSIEKLKSAGKEDIMLVSKMTRDLASKIYEFLKCKK